MKWTEMIYWQVNLKDWRYQWYDGSRKIYKDNRAFQAKYEHFEEQLGSWPFFLYQRHVVGGRTAGALQVVWFEHQEYLFQGIYSAESASIDWFLRIQPKKILIICYELYVQ